jgi:hypothetical protein
LEDNTWNLTEGLNKITETFSWAIWYTGQDMGATDERRWKYVVYGKTYSQQKQ